ncbi:MAG: helix-turn-helix transcriptional regulator [Planctomycetes bacterium]|nr:helix-turn-helix transcriptional regulator [Planctomycetota bacterium]
MLNEINHSPPRTAIPPDRWEKIAHSLKFSNRELQIVQQLFAGGSEADTGRALGISSHTVHTHLGRLYRKLNVHGCSGLFLRVFDAYVADLNASTTDDESHNETALMSRDRARH